MTVKTLQETQSKQLQTSSSHPIRVGTSITKLQQGLTIALGLLLTSTTALADIRWATIDINKVLNEASEAKSKKKELDAAASAARSKLEEDRKTLSALEGQIREKKLAEDSKEVQKFKDQARDFSRKARDMEDELKEKFIRVNKEITEKALRLVNKFAKENNLDLVLDKGEMMRGPVIYGLPSRDITPDIIKALNG